MSSCVDDSILQWINAHNFLAASTGKGSLGNELHRIADADKVYMNLYDIASVIHTTSYIQKIEIGILCWLSCALDINALMHRTEIFTSLTLAFVPFESLSI